MATDTDQHSPSASPVSEHVVDKETSEPTSYVASLASIAFTVMSVMAAVVYYRKRRQNVPLNFDAHQALWIYASALLLPMLDGNIMWAWRRRRPSWGPS